MPNFRPEEKNVVYVGEGVSLKGAINAQDIVVVDGTVDGEITCAQLVVGPNGVVNGAISVSDADVFGKIGTDISVKQLLILRSTGHIEGKWIYGEIEVEKGGILAGMAESTGFRSAERKIMKEDLEKPLPYKKPELVVSTPFHAAGAPAIPPTSSVAARALRDRKKQS